MPLESLSKSVAAGPESLTLCLDNIQLSPRPGGCGPVTGKMYVSLGGTSVDYLHAVTLTGAGRGAGLQ